MNEEKLIGKTGLFFDFDDEDHPKYYGTLTRICNNTGGYSFMMNRLGTYIHFVPGLFSKEK